MLKIIAGLRIFGPLTQFTPSAMAMTIKTTNMPPTLNEVSIFIVLSFLELNKSVER